MRPLLATSLFRAISCGTAPPLATGIDCGPTDERLGSSDAAARDCVWNAYQRGEAARWIMRTYTIEGDPVPVSLAFGPTSGIVVALDTTADRFGGVVNQRVMTWRCQTMRRVPFGGDPARRFALTNCTGQGNSTTIP